MKKLQLVFLYFILIFGYHNTSNAQLSDGEIAPDFTLTDIDGQTHNLYSILESGRHVVLDFSATWCGPCWSYHNSGALEDLYESRGPNGTNEVEIIYIEGDGSTNLNCLYGQSGCNDSSYGDWTTVPYPICSPTGSDLQVVNDYEISYFPTIYIINAEHKTVWETGQQGASIFENIIDNSFPMTVDVVTVLDHTCSNPGLIDIDVNFGQNPLNFSWSNGETTEDLQFIIESGSYSVRIRDINGYFLDFGPFQIDAEDSNLNIITEETIVQEVLCQGDPTGVISLSSYGGYGAEYTYEWSNGQQFSTASNLYGGDYEYTVTDEIGCTNSGIISLEEPPVLDFSLNATGSCSGQNNGTITLEASAGVPPFQYTIGGNWSEETEYENLSPGFYQIGVSDGNNCVHNYSLQVPGYTSPNADVSFESLEISCDNPSVDLSAESTSSSIAHQWFSDGSLISTDANVTVTNAGSYLHVVTNTSSNCQSSSTVEVISTGDIPSLTTSGGTLNCTHSEVNLCAQSDEGVSIKWIVAGEEILQDCIVVTSAGSYEVLAIADNGCTNSMVSTIEENFDIPELTSISATVLDCSSGTSFLDANYANYDIAEWANSNGDIINSENEIFIEVYTPGQYTLTLINENSGCSASMSVVVEENNDLPVISSIDGTTITCINDLATLSTTIDLPDSQYSIEWTNANGEVISDAEMLTVAESGMYNLEVTSLANSCVSNASVNVLADFDVAEVTSIDATPITCSNLEGTIQINLTKDSDLYDITWTNILGDILSSESQLSTDIPGIYTAMLITKSNGCQTEVTTELKAIIEQPLAEITLMENDDMISLNANTQNDVTYSWTIDGTQVSTDSSLDWSFNNTQLISVCLEVSNDCGTAEDCTTYQYVAPMLSTVTKMDNLCYDDDSGSLTIELEGGLPEYTIAITGPNDFTSTELSLNGLPNGLYSYTIIDAIDNTISGSVIINSPEAIVVDAMLVESQTNISNDGSIELIVSGGVEPYKFLWSNGSTAQNIDQLEAGTYTCVITDGNDCRYTSDEYIIEYLTSNTIDLASVGINIFPNPAYDILNITNDQHLIMSFEMMDITGKMVLSQKNIPINSIDVSSLKQGVYIIRMSNENSSGSLKFIKM